MAVADGSFDWNVIGIIIIFVALLWAYNTFIKGRRETFTGE